MVNLFLFFYNKEELLKLSVEEKICPVEEI
jgi:hypothetical protein